MLGNLFYFAANSANKYVHAPSAKSLPNVGASQATFQRGLTVAFTIIGAITVLMVIIGGIQYMTSSGDPGKASKAKNTIIFSLVGLIVCILAVTIVQFVLGKVT
jgi:hypothetical protein